MIIIVFYIRKNNDVFFYIFFNIIVEGNCSKVINFLNALRKNDHSYFNILIEDCLNRKRDFVVFNFIHVRCTNNTVAAQTSNVIFFID